MATTTPGANAAPPAARRSFWNRLTDGLELQDLWTQFRTEARAGYGLYSREVDWEAIRKGSQWKRPYKAVGALFMALLMKMSPARRVLLLIALISLFLGKFRFTLRSEHVSFDMGGLGVFLLLLLLALELADRVTMKRDLEIARDIQNWLVPAKPPEVKGLDIAFATRPANTVAGDYYDVFQRRGPDGRERLMIVVADVAGKSVPAALLMATFQASLHALAAASEALMKLVDGLNRYACAHSLGGMRFTTAFIGEYDSETRRLAYVCAGHNPPILRHLSGAVNRLDHGGLPLGIQADANFEQGEVSVEQGDVLLFFTDGTVEATNGKGEEYGDAGLLHLLTVVPGESAAEVLRHLFEDLARHSRGVPQQDDVTCLVLRAL